MNNNSLLTFIDNFDHRTRQLQSVLDLLLVAGEDEDGFNVLHSTVINALSTMDSILLELINQRHLLEQARQAMKN